MSSNIKTTVGEGGRIELNGIGEYRHACVIDAETLAVISYTETNEDGNIQLDSHFEGTDVQVVIP